VSSRRISIFDTTLRDGEQSPGIALQPHEKAEIAAQLERLGVDVIEAGFAASSPGDFEGVQAVARTVERATVASMCRARREDVDAAAEALADATRSRLHIVLGTSAIHMEKKLGLEPEDVLALTTWVVSYARARVDEVEFCCEDATRSDPTFVAQVCAAAIAAGAAVINLPDTVGIALPDEYYDFLVHARRLCPELERVVLSAHCHDDLGVAVANTLAAVRAGADQVEVTVNGIGERAGNASLEEVAMALRVHGERLGVETGVEPGELGAASGLVARLTGYEVPRNKAIVGANAFAHEAGIHQDGLLKDVSTYQFLDPAELGLAMTLPLGKHSGRHAFAHACAAAGLELAGEQLEAAFTRFKELADSGRPVRLSDLVQPEPAEVAQ
jgi:2-isopropylmalate synthase